jgi:hypothetical protein
MTGTCTTTTTMGVHCAQYVCWCAATLMYHAGLASMPCKTGQQMFEHAHTSAGAHTSARMQRQSLLAFGGIAAAVFCSTATKPRVRLLFCM